VAGADLSTTGGPFTPDDEEGEGRGQRKWVIALRGLSLRKSVDKPPMAGEPAFALHRELCLRRPNRRIASLKRWLPFLDRLGR
jgi:hypothetical protein